MKSPAEVREAVTQRLAASWHRDLTAPAGAWPHTFTLGAPTRKADLEADFPARRRDARAWIEQAERWGVPVTLADRRVHGTTQPFPTHLTVPDVDTAARLAGGPWPARLARARARLATLRAAFPAAGDLPRVVRAVVDYTDTDFTLLLTATGWFATHDATGLTPRQVPIEGLHGKWLNTHRAQILALTGRADLGLVTERPQWVHLTYLDPGHRAAGGRRHDSATVGDTMTPAYPPRTVLISENKDTAVHFPPTPGAIAVQGAGLTGAPGIAALDFVAAADHVIYWGDLDAAGFECVHRYRMAGLDVTTILMDLPTYEAYERFGTTTDAKGEPLPVPTPKALTTLTEPERALYDRLTDPVWDRVRRVEQERIPLAVAAAALEDHLAVGA